ncbi:hypothetical protein BJ170DRAFT_619305 [Xylariales sp. AK1849]|nr:hypothetical protein BJ170DRAFT_619305 [Xylariales sp. AK1849]
MQRYPILLSLLGLSYVTQQIPGFFIDRLEQAPTSDRKKRNGLHVSSLECFTWNSIDLRHLVVLVVYSVRRSNVPDKQTEGPMR